MNTTDQFPSAKVIQLLESLTAQPATKPRAILAWRLVTRSMHHHDFHAVLDFARDCELVVDCEQLSPTSPNLSWINPVDGTEMVWIPGGAFQYGEQKTIANCVGFSLARWPVTNKQYANFLAQTVYTPPDDMTRDSFVSHWSNGIVPEELEYHPVVFVSLFDALAYCHWAGMGLPSEWMWEKAARGTDGRLYPWGNELARAANLAHLASRGTCPVHAFSHVRSPFGCEQMVGNVSEWCLPLRKNAQVSDLPLGPYPVQFPLDFPSSRTQFFPARDTQVPVRGACFHRIPGASAKCSHQRQLWSGRRNAWVGFRPACLLPVRPSENY